MQNMQTIMEYSNTFYYLKKFKSLCHKKKFRVRRQATN